MNAVYTVRLMAFVIGFGDAAYLGSTRAIRLAKPIVGMGG
jgi:hypothetical protein